LLSITFSIPSYLLYFLLPAEGLIGLPLIKVSLRMSRRLLRRRITYAVGVV
jgi:hypothetical protein